MREAYVNRSCENDLSPGSVIGDQRRSRQTTALLYVVFAATGVGVTVPGTLLVPLLERWDMGYGRAGMLFFAFFLGSSSGALLSRGRIGRSVARGCGVAALGAAGLSFASYASAFPAIAVYGLGLGMAMTSVSLLQSRRNSSRRTAEMTRLNLVWAIGACLGPATLLRSVAGWGLQAVLVSVLLVFVLLGLGALGLAPNPEAQRPPNAELSHGIGSVPRLLLLLGPLATGVESGMGGWLATYSERSGHVLNMTIGAVTFFWGGLLLSRLAQSSQSLAAVSRAPILLLTPAMIFSGISLLMAWQNNSPMLAGALLVGLGVGPLYPLVLALLLAHGEGGNTAFVLGGVGAALFPLLMGLVSGWAGSIRIGLGVLLLASLCMAAIGAVLARGPTTAAGAMMCDDV